MRQLKTFFVNQQRDAIIHSCHKLQICVSLLTECELSFFLRKLKKEREMSLEQQQNLGIIFDISYSGHKEAKIAVNDRNIITSKINGTPKGVYLPISKLHSILAVANLLYKYTRFLYVLPRKLL